MDKRSLLVALLSLSCSTARMSGGAEICDNGHDDDGDQKTDCADPDCFSFEKCCINLCDDGVVLCDDMGIRTCQKNNVSGCNELSAPQPCSGTNVCSGGTCAATCTNRCALGEKQCIGAGAMAECTTLASGCRDWVVSQICSHDSLCVAGTCAPIASCTAQCTANDTRCTAAGAEQTCNPLGNGCSDWSFPQACSNGMACSGSSCDGTGGGAGGGGAGGGGNTTAPVPLGTVSAGTNVACAITSTGGVMCWGEGSNGVIGDGTGLDRPHPTAVMGITSGATAIAVGSAHACAVVSGGIKCWGKNGDGQLGDGTNNPSKVPVDVKMLGGTATQVVVGDLHTCALLSNGAVSCWGSNSQKQLASTAVFSSPTPLAIFALTSGVTQLAASGDRTCAVNGGQLFCWGDGDTGTTVSGLTGVVRVGLGSGHRCVTTATATQCWGDNSSGQCGTGSTGAVSMPTPVTNLSGAASMLALGSAHSCALLAGAVQCWGDSSYGQVGNGISTQSTLPVAVPLPAMADQITSTSDFTCAHLVNQTVQCWGRGNMGQLGNGVADTVPTPIAGLNAIQLAGKNGQTCALVSGGDVYCWGDGNGMLGGPSTTGSFVPQKVTGVSNATAIAMSTSATCVLLQGGGLKCWGYAPFVDDTYSETPADIMGTTSNIAGVSAGAGGSDMCVRNNAGALKCWTSTQTPQDITGLGAAVTSVSVGDNFKCALLMGGGVKCWGDNYYGELGDGMMEYSSTTPVVPTGLSADAVALGTGSNHACVLMASSGLKCWGSNANGQVGDGQGTSSYSYTPNDVAGLSGATGGVVALYTTRLFSCAKRSTGGPLKCWGDSMSSSITSDLLQQHAVPIDFPALGDVTQILSTNGTLCTIVTGGEVRCWGDNSYGQLGHPEFWTMPQAVQF